MALLMTPTRGRLVLAGELDLSSKAELAAAVDEAIALDLPIDIDARNVRFMDSSAVASLVALAQRVVHPLRMIKPPDVVRFLLELTDLLEVVEILEEDPGLPPTAPATVNA
ncbi:STAS domain-containing protein [Georgenia sp. AZ-5]|uniref:STAS domain-containing protein n=1 Tax=Georgenia sp. AZ-5 TaxID=3367526 RepID=UPI003754D17E